MRRGGSGREGPGGAGRGREGRGAAAGPCRAGPCPVCEPWSLREVPGPAPQRDYNSQQAPRGSRRALGRAEGPA